MSGAIPIELVNGGGPLSTAVSIAQIVGPILIAGAAVFAAKTARDSAIERQAKQLAHDTERQELAFAHEREMRERESTRRVIESAMKAANATIELFVEFESAIVRRQQLWKGNDEEGDEKERRALTELSSKCLSAIIEDSFHTIRLRSSPGLERITETYNDVVSTYRSHRELLRKGISTELSDDEMAELREIDAAGTKKLSRLFLAWKQWLGGELPQAEAEDE